ncbi:MAG: tRNA dihydrouridine synthase DusB [Pirellulales bacterium]|nr:tRNA dihydrouridine synthase DusB [Pirellulales bacterium]
MSIALPPDSQSSAHVPPVPRRAPLMIGPVLVDPPVLQAPMAGFTNYAYRQIVREFGGAGLQATEMISAKGFLENEEHSGEFPDRLWGVKDEPRPLAVQIWDNDPPTLAAVGARLAHEFRVSVVDINFGCPVKQVTEKAHSGSYLLRDPERVGRIVERVVEACRPTPVTAKIRLGCTRNSVNAADVARVVEQAGAAALTVHGRTAQEFFQGQADWDRIADIKEHLRRIPLIGNGDLTSAERAVERLNRYPVDGVMIARAALGKPWLFRQVAAALAGLPIPPDLTPSEEQQLLLHHYDLVVARFGVDQGTVLMRKFACCYAQGRPGAREFRTYACRVTSPADFHEVVNRHFPLRRARRQLRDGFPDAAEGCTEVPGDCTTDDDARD